MNWWGSGLIIILNYPTSSVGPAPSGENFILTENSLNIETENSLNLLTED